MTELIYMASPYSDSDEFIRQSRFNKVLKSAAEITTSELIVFSPIVHSHLIAVQGDLPGDFEFWNYFNEKIISVCDRFAILKLPGWKDSKGVAVEMGIAMEQGFRIETINPETLEFSEFRI